MIKADIFVIVAILLMGMVPEFKDETIIVGTLFFGVLIIREIAKLIIFSGFNIKKENGKLKFSVTENFPDELMKKSLTMETVKNNSFIRELLAVFGSSGLFLYLHYLNGFVNDGVSIFSFLYGGIIGLWMVFVFPKERKLKYLSDEYHKDTGSDES